MQYLKDILITVKDESPILYSIVLIHLIGTIRNLDLMGHHSSNSRGIYSMG